MRARNLALREQKFAAQQSGHQVQVQTELSAPSRVDMTELVDTMCDLDFDLFDLFGDDEELASPIAIATLGVAVRAYKTIQSDLTEIWLNDLDYDDEDERSLAV